jgi:hypothetical protein
MARVVLYDACVLYPAPLRDLLMRLALTGLFRARWTEEIHDEWIRSVLADRPDVTRESLVRCRELMDRHVPDCLVSGYEPLIPTLALPDPDDRHVLAAAIHGGAGAIVTFNLGDFPAPVLSQYNVEAVHPDEFVVRLWDESPESVLDAVRRQRAALRRPPKTAAEYLATLGQCRLSEAVSRLRPHEEEI